MSNANLKKKSSKTANKKSNESVITLEKLLSAGTTKGKGGRKDCSFLWSKKEFNLDLFSNIKFPLELKDDIRVHSLFYSGLTEIQNEFKRYIEEYDLEVELDDSVTISTFTKDLVNLDLLLYMAAKAQNRNEYPLENIYLMFSGIKKAMPSKWDMTIVDKLNVLFKSKFSKTYITSLLEQYSVLKCALFDIKSDSYNQLITIEDKCDIDFYTEKLLMIEKKEREAKNKAIKDGIEYKSIYADSINHYKERIKSLSDTSTYEYDKVVLKQTLSNKAFRVSLYEKILSSHHPYMYAPVIIPYPLESHYNEYSLYYKNTDENDDSFMYEELSHVFRKETKEAIHVFSMTEFIENRKKQKKKINLNKIKFNLKDAAESLDKKNNCRYWVDRIKNIEFKAIDWAEGVPKVNLSSTAVMTLKEAVHIVGMLGAGKSTFSTLLAHVAVENGLIIGFITKNKGLSIEGYEDMLKYNVGTPSIFSGYSNREESKKLLIRQCENVLASPNKDIQQLIEEANILDVLDNTSIIASKYERVFDDILDDRLECIPCVSNKDSKKPRQKTMYPANSEYLESGIYSAIEKLINSNVWIGNIHAFLRTKCPYQLDLFCRDFLTITNLVCDVLIIDEVDEIQSIADGIYNIDYGIASSSIRFSHSMVNDILYRSMIEIDRSSYKRDCDHLHRNYILEQQATCDMVLSLFSKLGDKAKAYRQFSFYSLKIKFLRKYFDLDNIGTKDLLNFSNMINVRNINPHEGFSTELEKVVYYLKSMILRKKDLIIYSRDRKDKKICKEYVDKMTEKYNNISFYDIEEKENVQIAYKNIYKHEFMKLIESNLDWQLKDIIYSDDIQGGVKRLNQDFLNELELLFLIGELDYNQRKIDMDTNSFAYRMGLNFDMQGITKVAVSPLFPDPLVNRAYTYSYTMPDNKKSSHRLNIKNYISVGREILFSNRKSIETLEGVNPPIYVMMSASSHMKDSSQYHVNIDPSYIIKNSAQDDTKITIERKFLMDGDKLIKVSGAGSNKNKTNKLHKMFGSLISEKFFENKLHLLQYKYDMSQNSDNPDDRFTQRQIIAIAMPSFELAESLARYFNTAKPDLKVKCLFSGGKTIDGQPIYKSDYHIALDDIDDLCNQECDIYIFVMSSTGRGTNILQKNSKNSLIGVMLFPVRPYLHPEDELYMIYALHGSLDKMISEAKKYCVDKFGLEEGFLVHKRLKSLSVILYNRMFNSSLYWRNMDEDLKRWMVANFLVSILQTIGRGIRGGTNLEVCLLDAAFIGEKTRKILEENATTDFDGIEECSDEDSFLSLCRDILSSGDEVFNIVNKPLIKAFQNMI